MTRPDILAAGVGGQGILTIAGIIETAAIGCGKADLLLAMEGWRHPPWLRPDGAVVVNRVPVRQHKTYPALETRLGHLARLPQQRFLDAEALAHKAGTVCAVLSALLGVAAPFLVISAEVIRHAVVDFFDFKGAEVVEKNLLAFALGSAAVKEYSSRV